MEVNNRDIVTTPGAKEPQGSAVVGGSGLTTGSNVTGPLRSSSHDREGTGVVSLAPATQPSTSAEIGASQSTKDDNSKLHSKLIQASVSKRSSDITTAMTALKNKIKQQNKLINTLMSSLDDLNLAKEKTKSTLVQGAIEKVIEIAEEISNNRNSLHSAFYEAEKTATKISSEQASTHAADQMSISLSNQDAILKICQELKTTVEKQQADIDTLKSNQPNPTPTYAQQTKRNSQEKSNALNPSPVNEASSGNDWKIVGRHKANPDNSERLAVPGTRKKKRGTDGQPTPINRRRLNPTLADAIAVKPTKGESPTEVLKRIKQGVDIETIGAQVSSIIESKNGEIIIRLHPKDSKRLELEDALKKQLGENATVRGLIKYEEVEVLDLDCATTEAELETCIRKALGPTESDQSIQVKSIRQSFRGVHRATVKLKSSDANALITQGRIKVGWMSARVRLKSRTIKCYRCLGYGHTRHECQGPDRSEKCVLCTGTGHKALDCTASPICAACSDLGATTDHYPGSAKCAAYRKASTRNKTAKLSERKVSAKSCGTSNDKQDA